MNYLNVLEVKMSDFASTEFQPLLIITYIWEDETRTFACDYNDLGHFLFLFRSLICPKNYYPTDRSSSGTIPLHHT